MRRTTNPFRMLALAGVLSAVAWGCSTDSPTAPRQEVPPIPPGGGQVYYISVNADPGGIVISESAPTGTESTTLLAEVRLDGPGGPKPADGTTVLMRTNLGSFSDTDVVREAGATLINGRAYATLFSGGTPIQFGVATVQAFLSESRGQTNVPIALLEASYETSNPENNLSVSFIDTSAGNPQNFSWDFGDGTSSNLRNPHHLFPGPGTYLVQLTVTKRVNGVLLTDRSDPADSMVTVTETEPLP